MAMAGALLEFSYSPDNAQEVVRAGGIDCMPGLLAFHFQDPAVFLGLELLWNCLESGAPGMRFGPIDASTTEAMARFMSRLLVAFLENGFRSGDKHSRNEARRAAAAGLALSFPPAPRMLPCAHLRLAYRLMARR